MGGSSCISMEKMLSEAMLYLAQNLILYYAYAVLYNYYVCT